MSLSALMVTAALLGAMDKPAEKMVAAERKKLEGGWMVLGAGGSRLALDDGVLVFVFSADKLVFGKIKVKDGKPDKTGTEEFFQATVILDPLKKPPTMDFAIKTGMFKGKTIRAIYHLKGDRMRLCYGGPDKPRPAKFEMKGDTVDLYCERPNPEAERKALASGEKVPAELSLPSAASARPLDPKAEFLYLHLLPTGEVVRPGGGAIRDLHDYLRAEFRRREGKGKVWTVVALRADSNAPYGKLFAAARACREQGLLRQVPITDDGLARLKGLAALRVLVFDRTKVGGDGMKHLKDLARLEEVHFFESEISIGFTRHLKAFPRLRVLSLERTTVGDEELKHLHGLTGLERLYLYRTKVTDAGVKELSKALPRLAVYR
jgi:uncharacterized protein (TIGR03067 family)